MCTHTVSKEGHGIVADECIERVEQIKCQIPQRCGVNLKEVFHHLRTHASCDRGAVLQAGAAIHLNEPHIQVLIHHKVVPKQLMTVGP